MTGAVICGHEMVTALHLMRLACASWIFIAVAAAL